MSRAFSPMTLGIGLTALLALAPGVTPTSSATEKASSAKADTTPKLDQKVEAVSTLLDQCLKERPRGVAAPTEVTILTLPDPQRTSMALWFDLRLYAVQRAFKDHGFLVRHFYLPWDTKGKEEAGGGMSGRFAESGPGLLWLARDLPTPAYHALLIVGESQALGINRVALREALALASRLRPATGSFRISILGPQFSGSRTSLAAALQDHFRDPAAPDVQVQGTTTMDAAAIASLRQAFRPLPPGRLQIVGWSCNLSGASKQQLLDWFMDQSGWLHTTPKIAIFTESNTVYGGGPAPQGEPGRPRPSAAPTQVFFPMGLSRLRFERQALERTRKGGLVPDLRLPSTLLGPAQDESLRVLDTVPQYSADSVRNTELDLAATIRGLARGGYTHIGIAASDPQDLIFLAERIRAYHPSCTLFTTSGTHALFAHTNYSQGMDGMILFGGYPLTDPMRAISLVKGDLESPVRFSSEGEYATYYATRQLLDRAATEADPGHALWGRQGFVSIVKGGSIWPLRHGGLLEPRAGPAGGMAWRTEVEADYEAAVQGSSDLMRYTQARLHQLVLLLVVLGVASWLYFLRPLAELVDVARTEPGLRPYWNLAAGALLVVATVSLLATGYLLPLHFLDGTPWREPFFWMGLLAWLGVLLLSSRALAGALGWGPSLPLLLLAQIPAALLWVWCNGGFGPLTRRAGHFLDFMPSYLRFTSPGRGVSLLPTLLLLAAGVALLLRTWFEIRRQDHDVFWPAPHGLQETRFLVLRHLRGLHFQPWTLLIVGALTGFQFLLPGGWIQPLMEGRGLTLGVVAVGTGLFTGACFLFWQFHRGWKELKHVLEVLDFCAYRASFAEAGQLIEWRTMVALGRGLTTRRSSLRGREVLVAQKGWASHVVPGYSAHLDALDRLDAQASSGRNRLGGYGKWRLRLATAREITACGDALTEACALAPAEAASHQAEVDLFQAQRAIQFIRQAFIVLRQLLIGSVGTLLLLVLAVATFDFQPKGNTLLVLSGALLAVSSWVSLVILTMERDPLLCLMEGSKPGTVQFSLGLLENGVRFVFVPLLLLLGTLNPSFGGFLEQLFNPIVHLLR